MIREIMHDTWFLSQKSEKATKEDAQIAQDLLDTLKANEEGCVGMAANMIGERKRIIVVNMGFMNTIMYNPVFVKKTGKYQTEEGCLSLIGVRKCTRYEEIEVEYRGYQISTSGENSRAGPRRSSSTSVIIWRES